MPAPNSRQTMIEYCLRRLGHPVLEVNVDPDQIEDRIDDAFQMYQQFHTDATEHVFFSYQLQNSDMSAKYVTLPNSMISVIGIVPLSTMKGAGMFNIDYQTRMSDWDAFYSGGSIMGYDIMMQHIDLLDFEFDTKFRYQFNPHQHKLFVEWKWGTDVNVGDWIVVEGYQVLDPDAYTDVWNDKWLKKYATALIKRQWGENLMKFRGTALLGGLTLNGGEIFQDALNEIEKLEEDLQNTYQLPPTFFVG